jgi:predicted metal-dependent hydrolase
MKPTDLYPEIHQVQYGNQSILFALEYSERQTLAIEVHPNQRVLVIAPQNATLPSIAARVGQRAAWITKQQRQFSRYAPPLPASECVSGKGYRYLGRQYRLKLSAGEVEQVRLWQGRLEVITAMPQDQQHVAGLIEQWYVDRAMKIFQERYQHCTQLVSPHGIEHNRGFELRVMSKRWGSCTPRGKIFLNPLLVSAPKDCIDYVIIHELCHVRIHNHSPRFYRLLETILPNWQMRRDYLNIHTELPNTNDSGILYQPFHDA